MAVSPLSSYFATFLKRRLRCSGSRRGTLWQLLGEWICGPWKSRRLSLHPRARHAGQSSHRRNERGQEKNPADLTCQDDIPTDQELEFCLAALAKQKATGWGKATIEGCEDMAWLALSQLRCSWMVNPVEEQDLARVGLRLL